MSVIICRSAAAASAVGSTNTDNNKDKPLFCSQKSFDDAIEVTIKLIDRFDRIDRVFAEEE